MTNQTEQKYADVCYMPRTNGLWACVVFRDAHNKESGRINPFMLHRGHGIPGQKEGVHGTLGTRIRKALDLIDGYRNARKAVAEEIDSINAQPVSTYIVDGKAGGNDLVIPHYVDPKAQELLMEFEKYAERCLLLVGIYARTIFEDFPEFGKKTLALRDENVNEVAGERIALSQVCNMLVHHRNLTVNGELLEDLYSEKETMWNANSGNSMGWALLITDYLDKVEEVLGSIQIKDLIGMLGKLLNNRSKSKDHMIVNLIREMYYLSNLLSEHALSNCDHTFFRLWVKEEVTGMADELLTEMMKKQSERLSTIERTADFRFPRFEFSRDLAIPKVDIVLNLTVTIRDPKTDKRATESKSVHKTIGFEEFAKTIANNWGHLPVIAQRG